MRNDYRQSFHIEPEKGWINDPNGLCFFGGKYHTYFQYCPDSAYGNGRKCWGHCESTDLVKWRFTGTVLFPDTKYDRDGVYSGCALSDGDTLDIYYTGNVKHHGDHDYIKSGREGNVIYVSTKDGVTMSEKTILLSNADYPESCSCHVRDPKVWRKNNMYYMALGARTRANVGEVLIYSSFDKKIWDFDRIVTTQEPFGYMWECPDIFTLDERRYLSVCPQGLTHGEYKYQNVYQSGYFTFDDALGDFTEWDMGFDFYAPQTFETPDKRSILIAWMGLPDITYSNSTLKYGTQHCLTTPRELSISPRDTIRQYPVKELLQQLCECKETTLPFAAKLVPHGSFSVALAKFLKLSYDEKNGIAVLKFSDAELSAGRTVRKARISHIDDVLILADKTSVEIFINRGENVFTTRFYPDDTNIKFECVNADYSTYKIAEV